MMNGGNIWLPVMVFAMIHTCENNKTVTHFDWQQFPQLPDAVGFAGSFAGVSEGYILVAGGANFPRGTRPWTGGIKQWSDKVFALGEGADRWEIVGKLPRPMGYGVSLTWRDQVILLGGGDQKRHYAHAYAMRYAAGKLEIDSLPTLPKAIANASGALIGDVIYIAGGLASPTATEAMANFWALDLAKPAAERHWEVLEPWPGDPRMLAVAGAVDHTFYLLSGVSLSVNDSDASPSRTYLTDAFRYTPGLGWQKIADLPHAVAAAPSPGYTTRDQRLLVFGGDDGSLAEQHSALKDEHPGFTTDILAYDVKRDAWQTEGTIATDKQPDPAQNPNASTWAPVTTTGISWGNRYVMPMGEIRPGVRTNRVLSVTLLDE
ncbi:galactose oxidase [Parapedobacter sp.]